MLKKKNKISKVGRPLKERPLDDIDGDATKSSDVINPKVIQKNFTEYDKKALKTQIDHPEWGNWKIGKELSKTDNPTYMYVRMKENEYLSHAINVVRANHAERLSRIITPKALRELEDALDDEFLSKKDKAFYVKLALDKEPKFADRKDANVPQMINIEQIQILIKQGLGEPDGEFSSDSES